jgi:hypothetical protein
MKLILLICISLLAGLLHTAAMPIADMDSGIMIHNTEMASGHTPAQHVKMMQSSHDSMDNHCPDNDYSCCLVVAVQSSAMVSIIFASREDSFSSPPSFPAIIRPNIIYRPPRFYPV